MRIFKRLVIFLAVNLLVCALMGFLLTDPSVVRIYLEDIRENGYDTLIIGTSHGETGLDPFILSDELGVQAFNASRRLMPVPDVYYMLRTANSRGTIRTVYYELDPSYWNSVRSISTHDDTCMLRHASLPDKARYAMDYLWEENYNYTLFNYAFDVSAVKKIPAVVRAKLTLGGLAPDDRIRGIYEFLNISKNFEYRGRGFRYGLAPDGLGMAGYEPFEFTQEMVSAHYQDAFDAMVRYCREQGIRLVCVVSALPHQRLQQENHEQAHAYFSALCAQYGVEFYDMNYLREGLLPRGEADYTDVDGHMMGPLAQRQTRLLAKIEHAQDRTAFFEAGAYVPAVRQ